MSSMDGLIEEIKKTAKEKGQEITDAEASESAHKLVGLFEILWKASKEDSQRKHRLKKEPDGFPVDGNYSCLVCGNSINPTNGWYDWYGNTCLRCHKAVKDGVIPVYVCTHRESFFAMWSLNYHFKIKHQTALKYIREGKLKPRIILTESGKPHEYIFLRKENPGLIERESPAKKSWNRNRSKEAKRWSIEAKAKAREEHRKHRERIDKILKRNKG